jgi:hypothetical protein
MSDKSVIIKALSITAVLLFSVIFGGAVGIVASLLGAAPDVAAVAAATIAVASAGVGLTVVAMLVPSSSEEKKTT